MIIDPNILLKEWFQLPPISVSEVRTGTGSRRDNASPIDREGGAPNKQNCFSSCICICISSQKDWERGGTRPEGKGQKGPFGSTNKSPNPLSCGKSTYFSMILGHSKKISVFVPFFLLFLKSWATKGTPGLWVGDGGVGSRACLRCQPNTFPR